MISSLILFFVSFTAQARPLYCAREAVSAFSLQQTGAVIGALAASSESDCPAEMRTSLDEFWGSICTPPPEPPAPAASSGPTPGCKATFQNDPTVDKDKEVASLNGPKIKYRRLRTTQAPPKGTILYFCGGPSPCDGPGAPRGAFAPGYDVIIFDPPGLGKNAGAFSFSASTTEGTARAALAIIRRERLGGGDTPYVIAGSSWGTKPATILANIAGSAGVAPPKSLVLDAVVESSKDFTHAPPMGIPDDANQATFKNHLKELLPRFSDFFNFFSNKPAPLRARLAALTAPQLKACVKIDAKKYNEYPNKCPAMYKTIAERDKFLTNSDCTKKYMAASHPVPSSTPIFYLSGSEDTITPPSSANAHAQINSGTKTSQSVFQGCEHGAFGGGDLPCSANQKIWEAAFTGDTSQNFSGLAKCGTTPTTTGDPKRAQ